MTEEYYTNKIHPDTIECHLAVTNQQHENFRNYYYKIAAELEY